MSKKFYRRRTHSSGEMLVDTGLRGGEVAFRIERPSAQPFTLSFDEAADLVAALIEALDHEEDEPLRVEDQ